MQIQNNYNSLNFTSIHFHSSKMNRAQQSLSNKVADIISYSDEYQHAANNDIDVYFLPGKSEKSVFVRFLDRFSENFFKKNDKQYVQSTIHTDKNKFTSADNILDKLKMVLSGEAKVEESDIFKIENRETDLGRLEQQI